MRIVGISYLDQYGRFFFSELGKEVEVAVILRIVPEAGSACKPELARWIRLMRSPVRVVRRQLDRALRWIGDPLFRKLVRHVKSLSEADDSFSIPCIAVTQDRVNHPSTVKLLEELCPDIIITCGAPVLKPSVFSVPKLAAINIHYGIAPQYRGENTLFWALYSRDYEHLGVTIHTIDAGIDTGQILAWVHPQLDQETDEEVLFFRSTLDAAHAMVPILTRYREGVVQGQPQSETGRYYRNEDRAIWHDAICIVRRQLFKERLPSRPGKVIACIRDKEGTE